MLLPCSPHPHPHHPALYPESLLQPPPSPTPPAPLTCSYCPAALPQLKSLRMPARCMASQPRRSSVNTRTASLRQSTRGPGAQGEKVQPAGLGSDGGLKVSPDVRRGAVRGGGGQGFRGPGCEGWGFRGPGCGMCVWGAEFRVPVYGMCVWGGQSLGFQFVRCVWGEDMV